MEIIVAAAVGGLSALAGAWLGGRAERKTAREIEGLRRETEQGLSHLADELRKRTEHETERHRFRHEIGQFTARARLDAHTEFADRVAQAYRSKVNLLGDAKDRLNVAKNYYYDHRFFFSVELGGAFANVARSLGLGAFNKAILEENLNQFFLQIREDLLLRELAESAVRAVAAGSTDETTIHYP